MAVSVHLTVDNSNHYYLSVIICDLARIPAVCEAGEQTIISAPGTSCRHQIKDGTGRQAKHPVEVLYDQNVHLLTSVQLVN